MVSDAPNRRGGIQRLELIAYVGMIKILFMGNIRNLRRICTLGAVVTLVALLSLAAYISRARSFDNYASVPSRQRPSDWLSHVKVGIIGDSWVANRRLDEPLRQCLSAKGLNVEVVSSGHPGAQSRQIYRNLLADQTKPNSSKALLLDPYLDYLVVVAGANDTNGHIGRDFYAHHIVGIVKAAQDRAVQPIVVEVPEYGIECMPSSSVFSRYWHHLFRYLFDGGKVNVIEDYRSELLVRLRTLEKPVSVIPFSFVRDYASNTNYYANPLHLNQKGDAILASLIAEEVINLHYKAAQGKGASFFTQETNRISSAASFHN